MGAKKKATPFNPPRLGLPLRLLRMDIVAEKRENSNTFQLGFNLYNGADGSEFLEYKLPYPAIIQHCSGFVRVVWLINGYAGTNKAKEFLNDIIARFLITFAEYKPQRINYKIKVQHNTTAELKEFSKRLESIKAKRYVPARADSFDDHTFWAIKLYAEDTIRDNGFIVYDSLESWALNQFIDKERSTIKAKCRSIWHWYEERNFQLPQKHKEQKIYLEETMATRKAHITQLNRTRGEQNKRAVINVITGLFADDYKKKTGAWHFAKIAEQVSLSSKTVAKIIKEYEAEL